MPPRLVPALAIVALAGCTAFDDLVPETPPGPDLDPGSVVARIDDFDLDRSRALLDQARGLDARGDVGGALDAYLRAGFAWPDQTAAWEGVVATGRRAGDGPAERAGEFLVQRVRAHGSEDLATQRVVAPALRARAAEARAEGSDLLARGADRLAEYHEAIFAQTFRVSPGATSRTIQRRDLPAVIGSGALGVIYVLVIGAG